MTDWPCLVIVSAGYPLYYALFTFFGASHGSGDIRQTLFMIAFTVGILAAVAILQPSKVRNRLFQAAIASVVSFFFSLYAPTEVFSHLAIVVSALASAQVVVYSFFVCVFLMLHWERFLSCSLLIVLTYGLLQGQDTLPENRLQVVAGWMAVGLGLALAFAAYRLLPGMQDRISPETSMPVPQSVYLLLVFVLFIYVVDIAFVNVLRDAIPVTAHESLSGFLWLFAGLIMVAAALAFFRESTWIIWAIYFLTTMFALFGAVLYAGGLSVAGSVFRALIDLSIPAKYFLIWYVSGIFCLRYKNVLIVRVAFVLSCVGIFIGVALSGAMRSFGMEVVSASALALCGLLVLLFTLCTPVFYTLFRSESLLSAAVADPAFPEPQVSESAVSELTVSELTASEAAASGPFFPERAVPETNPMMNPTVSMHQGSHPTDLLTPQERRIHAHLLEGYTLRQISGLMHIKYNTVVFHYKNVYRKLGVNSRYELVLKSMQNPP